MISNSSKLFREWDIKYEAALCCKKLNNNKLGNSELNNNILGNLGELFKTIPNVYII
jgi:hypothetical protein